MSGIFLDTLAADVERTQRVNQTLALLPQAVRVTTGLRPVKLLVISPSERIDMIASRHTAALPRALRGLMGCSQGSSERDAVKASAVASYLLFDSRFTQALMALGHADAMRQREAIQAFFGWAQPDSHQNWTNESRERRLVHAALHP